MTLKDKIEQIDLDKIVDATSRVKVQAFINKVEATAESSPDDAMNLIDGLIGKLSLSNPQALRTKISKAEAQKKVDKIKKMKNIVPQKADIVKIKAQIAKQYPTWDDDRVEELANIRIQAQVDRADSIKKMIENLEKTNLYAGKVSNAPIDYVAPKEPSRIMRNRNLPKDAKTSAITEAEELRLPNGRKYKRKSPTYGKAGGAKRPYYYEYRMNRRDVDSKIQLARGGYADPENATHVLHIDGQNWYLEKIDSTHFYMSNDPTFRGMAHHIGQHNGEPYYDEVRTWLKESGGKYAEGGRAELSTDDKIEEIVARILSTWDYDDWEKIEVSEEEVDTLSLEELEEKIIQAYGLELQTDNAWDDEYRKLDFERRVDGIYEDEVGDYYETRHYKDEDEDEYAQGGRLDRVQFTKLATLGYRQEAPNQWRFVDLVSTEDLGSPVAVGDIYKTKKELLADLDNFAEIRGYEYAQGGKFPKRSMNIEFTDDFFEQGRGNSSMKIQEFPDPSFFSPSSSNIQVGDNVEFRRDPSGRMSDNIYLGTVVEINGGMAKIDHQNSNMKNVIREVAVSELKKYAKGGNVQQFYVGQTVSYPITKSTRLDKGVKNYFNKFADKQLVIEEIIADKPYNLAKVFDKVSGEKISGHLILNPKVITKYAKGGNVSIPNADKMMHLPMEVTASEMRARVKEVETYLAETFGGFTSSEKVGGYLSERSGVITEKVVPVTAFATSESFAKNKNKLVNKLAVWAKKWSQEAMGLEFEGDLYYVPQKFKKGGRLTATYIPNEDIESIRTRFGQTFSGKDVLDGAYVKRKVKTPKVTRYMFEEEEYEYAKGGALSASKGGQFMIDYCYADVYVDDYEKGEGSRMNSKEFDFMVGEIFNYADLLDILAKNLGLTEDPSDYSIFDNRIATSKLENGDGETPSISQMESWKKGKTKLYSVHYEIGLKIVKVSDTTDKLLSKLTSISIG
jgi:hypothetical protein